MLLSITIFRSYNNDTNLSKGSLKETILIDLAFNRSNMKISLVS